MKITKKTILDNITTIFYALIIAIIIRSLLNYKNISEVAVASGVILGSTAIKEYNENFIKAKSLLDIFKSWYT